MRDKQHYKLQLPLEVSNIVLILESQKTDSQENNQFPLGHKKFPPKTPTNPASRQEYKTRDIFKCVFLKV